MKVIADEQDTEALSGEQPLLKYLAVIKGGSFRGIVGNVVHIVDACTPEAAAREAARYASVGGLRKGVEIKVVPLDEADTFHAQYSDSGWEWYPNERGPQSPPVDIVVTICR